MAVGVPELAKQGKGEAGRPKGLKQGVGWEEGEPAGQKIAKVTDAIFQQPAQPSLLEPRARGETVPLSGAQGHCPDSEGSINGHPWVCYESFR